MATLEYLKSLPRKRMASGAIIRNGKGEMLVLKTTYKDHWEIPGGVVEEDESPKQAVEREVKEELNITIHTARCLVVHYRAAQGEQDENIMFVFDGGMIEQEFTLDSKEIAEARFVSFTEAAQLCGKRIASRLAFCAQALEEKRTIYLESIDSLEPDFVS